MLAMMVALVLAATCWGQTRPPSDWLYIHDVTLIDATGAPAEAHRSVVVRDHRIVGMVSSAELEKTSSLAGTWIDGRGKFLIPGLWDMHVHMVFGEWFPQGREITLPLLLANGITGVRDMGGELEVLEQWRTEISEGTLLGPRIVMAGPMLDGPKPRFPSSIAIRTAEDGRRAVDDWKRRGADSIKLQSLIPRDAVFAIADESRRQGMTLVGHVPDAVRPSEMSNAGQKSFEHPIGIFEGSSPLEDQFLTGPKTESQFLSTYDPQRAEKLFELLAKNQTWQCPTLVWERGGNLIEETDFAHDPRVQYVPRHWTDVTWKRFTEQVTHEFNSDDLATRKRFVAKELEVVDGMHRAGIPFLAGTDTPFRRLHLPRLQPARGIAAVCSRRFHSDGGFADSDAQPSQIPGKGKGVGND
jgi:hypothetical protein